jgi:hypothetical protein
VKYVLAGLHRHNFASSVVVDYDKMTIEHLVPQSQIGKNGFTDAIVGQIGNLILVSPDLNGQLKDKSFPEKKEILAKHSNALPKDLTKISTLDAATIQDRTKVLARSAFNEVWML